MAFTGKRGQETWEWPCDHHQWLLSIHHRPRCVLSLFPAFPHLNRYSNFTRETPGYSHRGAPRHSDMTGRYTLVSRFQPKYADPRTHAVLHCLSLPHPHPRVPTEVNAQRRQRVAESDLILS